MLRTHALLIVLSFAVISVVLTCLAQEQKVSTRSFYFRTTESPADPDPARQTVAERTATLRKRMNEAKALFEAGKVEECIKEYVDPFWIARGAEHSGMTIDDLFDKQLNADNPRAKEFPKQFAKTIDSTQTKEPKWLLNGRVASFVTDRSSHTAEFWVYFEGKWRISPET